MSPWASRSSRSASVRKCWWRSRFLRDYLYVPLGGSRHGAPRRTLNLLVVMTLGGLWHGAGWTFVVWGALHGALLVVNHAWRAIRGADAAPRSWYGRIAGWALTFAAVSLAWVFFRAADLNAASIIIRAMVRGSPG